MSSLIKLSTPLDESTARSLHAADRVLLSGPLLTARDAAHLRLCQLIEQGDELPVELAGQIIYYVGPTPAGIGKVIGSAGPTTSSRMDRFAPMLYARGLRGTIGKGYRSREVMESLQKYNAVHFTALGGAGALLSKCITSSQIIAYEDLGTEAIRKLEVVDFPVVVAYDVYGRSVYELTDTRK
jgi:fumarate hydratase subunit beta